MWFSADVRLRSEEIPARLASTDGERLQVTGDADARNRGEGIREEHLEARLQGAIQPPHVPASVLNCAPFGFRLIAYLIDSVVLTVMVVFESAFLYDRLLPEVYTLDEFWRAVVATWLLVLASIVAIRWITDALGVTPGRLLLGIRIVDAATGRPPGWRA